MQLIKKIIEFPYVVLLVAREKSPHYVATYLKYLASDFHSYYNESKFLIDDSNLKKSRIALIAAISTVIQNGLSLLGISAPEKM